MAENAKRIFTFWEKQDKKPAYIDLCIDTWKKYLPEYEIIELNYSNLEQWIGRNYYDKILFEEFDETKESYAIRAAVLERHGGVWFDADTIITSDKIHELINSAPDSELIILDGMTRFMAAKKHSRILKIWIKKIKHNLLKYKILFPFYFRYFPFKSLHMISGDYFAGKLLRGTFRTKNKKKLYKLDFYKINAMPEFNWDKEKNHSGYMEIRPNGFNHFWINSNFADYALENNHGIICLHNSWMSRKYRKMTKEEVLNQPNTLGEVFRRVL